ncbi:putative high affinity copper protein [Lasiosphaeris hirsuta]|uniref:Copper transport protein n=1 Tax=Lasiosphaeris hirsuta TaxID=260670 RepID=A0AA40AY10_9PEZI|nr:putative high affinity copper protein [Lasiosphaeris hirsuta]
MDMGTMSMSPTATAASAAATSTATATMDMGMGSGDCKISMLWNWYTIDSCFISSTWHVTSSGMFAGSCIGVILLVMSLEFLRRAVKEYDRFLIRQHGQLASPGKNNDTPLERSTSPHYLVAGPTALAAGEFRPTIFQQAVRAFLHMVQFAVAYLVMLLAMYYNGYIIICIFIGAFLGAFVFQWETLGAHGKGSTSASNEATVCCG